MSARKFCLGTIVLSASLVFSAPAYAQDLTWDANGAAAGSGGTGAWNTTSSFWFNGVTHQAWNNAALDNAIFAGSAGNITLGTPITVHDMTFNVGGYLFPSSGTTAISFGGINPTITTNVGMTQIFVSLTGSTGFTKNGVGTLQLSGNSVGYTGVTTVNAGILAVSNTLALGLSTAASNLVLNNGATIVLSTPPFTHNYTLTGGTVNVQTSNTVWSGSPTLTASTTLNLNGSSTTGALSGNLADTGANILSVTRSDTGRMTLSGNNSYTGATTITRGELQLGSIGALSAGSNLVFNGAAGTGGVIVLTSSSGNFTRSLGTGAGQVQWLGDGGFKSSGTGLNVNLGGAGATLTWGAGGFVPDGNRLILGTNSNNLLDFQNGIDLTGGVRAVQGDGGLITGHARMSGILSGTGGLNQVGNGFLELSGVNTYSGGTTITSGTLLVGSDANLGDVSGALTFSGGTLQNTGAFTTNRTTTLNASGGTFLANANLTATGAISGTGRLTKTGSATLTLTGTNNYSGGTTIGAGTLQIGNGGTSGSIAGNVIDNGVLAFNRSDAAIFSGNVSGTGSLEQRGTGTTLLSGTNTYTGGTTIGAGTLQIGNGGTSGSIAGNVIDNGVLAFNRSDAAIFSGNVSGTGSLEQRGTGTLTLTGINSYTGGTVLADGTVSVVADSNLGAAAGQLIFDGGRLQNTGAFTTSRNITLNAPGGTFQTNANLVASGSISGAGTLTKTGAATLTITGSTTHTGGTAIGAGTLQIGNGGTSGSIAGDVIDNGVLAFNRSDALAFDGVITGAGSIEQRGSGTLTLTGANIYSGGTTISAGTLEIGNGGTSGSIAGDIIDNGVLAFNRSDAAIFSGAVSGTGSLNQRGTGSTILSGANTYAGGTTVSAGTLQIGNGGTTGSILGNVSDSGVLAFDRSDGITFSGLISGGGSLEQRGTGTLTLTGANSYTGGTVLADGTVSVVADSNLGAAAGQLTFNGGMLQNTGAFTTGRNITLNAPGGTFRTNANLVASGSISGAGALTKTGAATLTLTGANSYTGGTVIDVGTVEIGNGGTSGSIAGDVVDNGVLAFNRSDALAFDGVITGAGIIEQRGSGALALTGNSAAFAGTTSIMNGMLIVNGSLGGVINILSGGRLQGVGTLGTTNVASGGTLAAGDPFGMLTVAGNLGFATGSTFEVKTDSAGVMNLLHDTGTTTISGGTVNVITENSSFRIGARYTILTADAGRTGQFDALTESFLLLDMTLAYDANHVYLDVARNSTTLCSLAVTQNQCATSRPDVFLGASNPIVDAVRSLPELPAIQNALDLLSGEVHASAKSTQLEDSRYIRDAVTDRLRQSTDTEYVPMASGAEFASSRIAATEKGAVWGHAFGSSGHQDGDGNAARIDSSVSGFFAGADTLVDDNLRVGVAAGYSKSSYDVDERTSSASSNDYHLAFYGGKQWGPLGLRVGTAYTLRDIETDRSIVFPGFSGNAAANYNSHTMQLFGEAGYALPIGDLKLEPFTQLAYVNLSTDSFNETGTLAALNISKDDDHITYTTIGLHAAQTFPFENASIVTVRGALGWRSTFGDDVVVSTHGIGNGPTFDIAAAPIANNALVVDAGFDVEISSDVSLGIAYSGQIASDEIDNGVRAHFSWRF